MLARIRRRLLRPAAAPNVDLRGQRAVVTGVSAGSLGAETAATLAAWGATVVVTRRAGAAAAARELEQRSGATVHGYDLDLANARSVREFARWYEGALGNELDVLVNNAGIHLDLLSEWEAPRLSPDGFETQWRTNYLGSFQLTLALLPALLAAGAVATFRACKAHVRIEGDAIFINPDTAKALNVEKGGDVRWAQW